MIERRDYYRIETVGRVALRRVTPEQENEARLRVRARSVPNVMGVAGVDEGWSYGEDRAQLELLHRIAISLHRIEHRIEELTHRGVANADFPPYSEIMPLSLSGSGVSGAFDLAPEAGALVEASIDLVDAGLPLVPVLASIARIVDDPKIIGLHFEEIMPTDRERIVQFAIRMQSLSLRRREKEEAE